MKSKLFWTVFVLAIVIDQAVKAWARSAYLPRQAPGFPWPGIFELTLQYNEGIAFGMFQGIAIFLTPIAVAIAIGSYFYSRNHPEEGAWTHVAMALLAGGALGNLIDRVAHLIWPEKMHGVTDMFSFRAIHFPVFNVADSCITIAAAILILKWTKELLTPHHGPEPGPLAESEPTQQHPHETAAQEAP